MIDPNAERPAPNLEKAYCLAIELAMNREIVGLTEDQCKAAIEEFKELIAIARSR